LGEQIAQTFAKANTLIAESRTNMLAKFTNAGYINDHHKCIIHILQNELVWQKSIFAHELDNLISKKLFSFRSIVQAQEAAKKIKAEKHQKHLEERRVNDEKPITVQDLRKEIAKIKSSLNVPAPGNRPRQKKGKGPAVKEQKQPPKAAPAKNIKKDKKPNGGTLKSKGQNTTAGKAKSGNTKKGEGKKQPSGKG
jgi:hypothetical protein